MTEAKWEPEENEQDASLPKNRFDPEVIRSYPKANKKVSIEVMPFHLAMKTDVQETTQTTFISPHGLEFQGSKAYTEGSILKLQVVLPDFWSRKQRYVDYSRVDSPESFTILGKVVKTQDVGKRGKKKVVTIQTLNMDEVDEKVLKAFLSE